MGDLLAAAKVWAIENKAEIICWMVGGILFLYISLAPLVGITFKSTTH
jgi:hypothetical protein